MKRVLIWDQRRLNMKVEMEEVCVIEVGVCLGTKNGDTHYLLPLLPPCISSFNFMQLRPSI